MKIGIFLGYAPGTVLGKEGLGRYLGNLIKNIQSTGNEVIIACPQWLCHTLSDLFGDFHIETDSVEMIVEKRIPVVWKIYTRLTKKTKQRDNKHFKEYLVWGIDLFINGVLSITSMVGILFLGIFCLLIGLLALPFFLLGTILYGCLLLCKCIKNRGSRRIGAIVGQIADIYEQLGKTGLHIYMQWYNYFLEKVHTRLIRRINRVDAADVWYSPAIFWPAFNKIRAPRVVNVPDLVTEDFALKWGNHKETLYSTKLCEKTIDEADYFVVYSDYVKENVVVKKFGKARARIAVIPHGINDLGKYVTIDSHVICQKELEDAYTASYCRTVINSLGFRVQGVNEYIRKFNFGDVKYIFFPTQARPHKNLLNLIKAFEYLLRKRYVRVKLFLTCKFDTLPEVKAYIFSRRLQYDIISFYDVSISGLAALYHEASLVVNPTLYEGGFPFTFGEGMSVGCPSVMSRIPQVCEMTDRFGLDDILFDPYNIKDIAEKIEYGLCNRQALVEKERQLFDWMQDVYSQEKVGNLYVQVFENIVKEKNG